MTGSRPPRIADGFFGTGTPGSTRAPRDENRSSTKAQDAAPSTSPTRRTRTRPASAAPTVAKPKRRRATPATKAHRGKSTRSEGSRGTRSDRREPTGSSPRSKVSTRGAWGASGGGGRSGPPRRRRGRGHSSGGGNGPRDKSIRSTQRRFLGIGTVLCLLMVTTVGKLTDLQVVSPARYRSAGVAQRTVHVGLPAARGAILDRNGGDMAVSIPRSTVVADPAQVSEVEAEAKRLAPILDMQRAELEKLLSEKSRFVYLDRLVSDQVARRISDLAEDGKLDGIYLISEYKRVRPNGTEARSLIGLTDIDGRGISGLELQYNDLLMGHPGEVSYERSAMGPIPGGRTQLRPSSPGDDLVLSIDLPLQFATEQLVAKKVHETGAESGIAIVARPSTGEILAMVNVNADPDTGKVTPSTNNEALTTVYEPGSVNKVITVAGALAEGKVTPSTVLSHPPTLTLGGATFIEAEALPSQLSVTDILTVSSNIGTIKLAQMLGPKTLDAKLREFGFGRKTALDFPNESPGLMLPLDQWSGSSIGSIPIGQGISVTAMQMLQVYSTIANNGVSVAPKLVTATVDTDGQRHRAGSSEKHRVLPVKVAKQVRGMLANVVRTGTGQKAAVPGYQVAGKTGTARKPLDEHMPGDGYMDLQGNYHYVSTFVGMLPAGDPQLSIIVVVNDPDRSESYYASDTAAPLFGQIARVAVRRLRLPPTTAPDATVGLPAVNPDLLDSPVDPTPTTTADDPTQ